MKLVLEIVAVLLMLAGMLGIWLAMNSPIQLQPIPLIVLVFGLILLVCCMHWPKAVSMPGDLRWKVDNLHPTGSGVVTLSAAEWHYVKWVLLNGEQK